LAGGGPPAADAPRGVEAAQPPSRWGSLSRRRAAVGSLPGASRLTDSRGRGWVTSQAGARHGIPLRSPSTSLLSDSWEWKRPMMGEGQAGPPRRDSERRRRTMIRVTVISPGHRDVRSPLVWPPPGLAVGRPRRAAGQSGSDSRPKSRSRSGRRPGSGPKGQQGGC
jgi:hypothetical protein